MYILETQRLRLRPVVTDDASFILNLVNQPSWLEFIGDHEVYDLGAAVDYIIDGPQTMFAEYGFALRLVEQKDSRQAIGLCGLVKRDSLPQPDLGFAFLPQFAGQGYAYEAALAALRHGRERLGIGPVLAITKPENGRSIKLLERLGFTFLDMHQPADDASALKMFIHHAPASNSPRIHAANE